MILRHLHLHQFRNFPILSHEFSPAFNVFVGENAQGKSNLLEAIYLLATSKSMRGSKDDDLVRWDEDAGVARGEVLRRIGIDVDLEVGLSRTQKKTLVVNGMRVPRAMDFVGQLKAVSFGSWDLELVRGEPSQRRRFLDLVISQLSPAYCHALACYRKVLEQRNRALKLARDRHPRGGSDEMLDALSDQLRQYGARLVERRSHFLVELEQFAREIHEQLTSGQERLSVVYRPSFRPGAQALDTLEVIEDGFAEALRSVRLEELRRQVTLIGPHRDEVRLLINGREARTFGSQGQQRTVALSIKLAEVAVIRKLADEAPVCLLDDVFSELDASRRAQVLEVVREQCQVFLTTTETELLPVRLDDRASLVRVCRGSLEVAKTPPTVRAA
jgi:DNA replication and repair protein RecF